MWYEHFNKTGDVGSASVEKCSTSGSHYCISTPGLCLKQPSTNRFVVHKETHIDKYDPLPLLLLQIYVKNMSCSAYLWKLHGHSYSPLWHHCACAQCHSPHHITLHGYLPSHMETLRWSQNYCLKVLWKPLEAFGRSPKHHTGLYLPEEELWRAGEYGILDGGDSAMESALFLFSPCPQAWHLLRLPPLSLGIKVAPEVKALHMT